MRCFPVVGALAVVCAVSIASAQATLKMAFINSQYIFKEYSGTKEAQDKFDKEVAKLEQEATNKKQDLEKLKDQLDKQSLLLSAQRKKELEDQFKQKYAEYQTFLQEKLGQNGEVLKRNAELTKPIIEKINKIIEKIAKDERYDFIFDEANGSLVYGKPLFDLSERVLKVLNTEGLQ